MSTLNYIGSKKTLLTFIDYVLQKINPKFTNTNKIKFLDGFAGSGIVGKHFNQQYGYNVYSNDLEYYSYIISYALLKVPYSNNLEKQIEELNKLTATVNKEYNLITENYSEKGKEKRKFWSVSNAEKADAIIEQMQTNLDNKTITKKEYVFLLASLLSSFDKVANTASVYGAYLKEYKTSSLKKLDVKPIHINHEIINDKSNKVFNKDVNSDVITNNKFDIVYLDPPYNNRQYSSNYHPLNFVAKYSSEIIPYGKTGLLENSNKSDYSISKNVENSFKSLIKNLDTKYILLSYNNEGLMNSKDIKEIMSLRGKYGYFLKEYNRFKADKPENRNYMANRTFEYLHYVVCA